MRRDDSRSPVMKNPAVARVVLALAAGALFGFGLSLSGMVDPARVSGFLDVASGHWDPSLMFVLGGAVMVAVPGVLLSRRLAKPVLAEDFSLPVKTRIDRPLITGSAIFGVGWGLAGFCPGPALSALALGLVPVVLFVSAMIAGMLVHDRLYAKQP
ncbi:putative membrane protein; permease family [Agrobacterium deltaense RV3]|nr:putative membrane protein; permease family [Agrobacterium deltaense RV3]